MNSFDAGELLILIGEELSKLIDVKIVRAVVSGRMPEVSISLSFSFLEFLRNFRHHLKHKVDPVFELIGGTCVDTRPKEAGVN